MADNKNDKHKNKKQLTDEQNDRTVAENENEKAQKAMTVLQDRYPANVVCLTEPDHYH